MRNGAVILFFLLSIWTCLLARHRGVVSWTKLQLFINRRGKCYCCMATLTARQIDEIIVVPGSATCNDSVQIAGIEPANSLFLSYAVIDS